MQLALQHKNAIESVRHYVQEALSPNTRKAYAADLVHYSAWGGTIPAHPEMVAAYISAHAEQLSIATLQRRLIAIGKAHVWQQHPNPVQHELVQLTMRGIKRTHGKPQDQAAPLIKEELILMLAQMPATTKGIRDRALLMLGFCGALRRSELVAIKREDIALTSQGIILTLPRSKTDQHGEGRKIGIPYGRVKYCPVTAVIAWLDIAPECCGVVFRPVTKGGIIGNTPLSDRAVSGIIKHYAAKAGLDPANYSGHSLRAGLATSAAQQGISSWVIRKQTGHKSEAMLARYIRDGELFSHNAAALF